MEKLLEEISFEGPDLKKKSIKIDGRTCASNSPTS